MLDSIADTTPQIFLGNELLRSMPSPPLSSDDSSIIDDDDKTKLGELLRKHEIKHADKGSERFWSLQLLRRIVSRKRILDQCEDYISTYIDFISPEYEQSITSQPTYLRIFALLLLAERADEIANFIKEGVSDQSLPVTRVQNSTKVHLSLQSNQARTLSCFERWKIQEREWFETTQWQVLVPYFDFGADHKAMHYKLHENAILPWCERGTRSLSSSQPSQNDGGYASVSCVKIHPSSHGFGTVKLRIHLRDDLFAIKQLHDKDYNNEAMFQNEVDQLQRFNGWAHDHLVTLLATFTIRQRNYLVFPFADFALDQYWEVKEPKPTMDIATVRWVSEQVSGLMKALDTIHNPKHMQNLEVKKYGRHGDIKPDNILWFKISSHPRGILVISDMGLSALNRDTSRSNIPNSKIPKVPGYRPPECDVEGGTISRAYDIWTFGCLFLELLSWLVGGQAFIDEFEEKRKSIYINGALNNIFFELKKMSRGDEYVAQVKDQVRRWFDKLHEDNKCSEYIHDTLDIIEKEMLIVLSEDRKRSSSGELSHEFKAIHLKCMTHEVYCIKAIPSSTPRLFRAATGVVVNLNKNAENTIKEIKPELRTYVGETRKSMRPEDLRKMG